jgi:AmmeMemoRadiSam system protein A
VTLEEKGSGDLRGCIGHIVADTPLGEVVAHMATAAALEDGRFPPVTPEELDALHIEISALGPLRRVKPQEIEVGVHGLLVRQQGLSGLLLPQVATDHNWDRETFLDFTCRKARLPAGSWRDAACEIYAFTATVFGE